MSIDASLQKITARVIEPHTCDADAPRAPLIAPAPTRNCARPRAATDLAEPEPQPNQPLQSKATATAIKIRQYKTMRRIVAVATIAAARAQLDAAGHAGWRRRRDEINDDATPGLRGSAWPGRRIDPEGGGGLLGLHDGRRGARLRAAGEKSPRCSTTTRCSRRRTGSGERAEPARGRRGRPRVHLGTSPDGDDAVPCKPEV